MYRYRSSLKESVFIYLLHKVTLFLWKYSVTHVGLPRPSWSASNQRTME